MEKNIYGKLPRSFKKRWIAALRSGEFKRATGTLVKLSKQEKVLGNCCLGVACAIQKVPLGVYSGQALIDKAMTKKAKFPIPKILISTSGSTKAIDKLVKMNDSRHGSFAKIANWIEKNL